MEQETEQYTSPYAQRAMDLFLEGYNCAQSLVGAFYQDIGLDWEQAMRLSSSFGGGMGRLREVCGAVSGMFMVIGLLQGYTSPKNTKEKTEQYTRVQELAHRFRKHNTSIICREMLGISGEESPTPSNRTAEYYKKRPCMQIVGSAAQILVDYLAETGINLSSGTCSK